MSTRILITGSRHWTNVDMIRDAMAKAIADVSEPVTFVHGGASGADEIADELAPMFGPHVGGESWLADWSGPCQRGCRPGHRRARRDGTLFCPAAGCYRNQLMVDVGAVLCLAFPLNESPGTHDCMDRARAAGIPVIDVPREVCAPLFSTATRAKNHAFAMAGRSGTKPLPWRSCHNCRGFHVGNATPTT